MATETSQAFDVSLATGRSHKLPLVPVIFRVHEELKCLDPDLLAQNHASVEGKPVKSILPAEFQQGLQSWPASQSLEKNSWGKPKVADDRWVYVFRARALGGLTLDSEIQVKADGDQQQCKCVSWVPADKQKWAKQFPRPASVTKKVFYLASDDQHFVLLSDFQLPYKRIDFYTTSKGQAALKRRALEIPKGALSQVDKLPGQIDLVDARLIAKKAHARAKKAREDYLKFTGDETTAAKRYIADFLWQISKKEEKVDKWVAMAEVEAFRQDQEKKLRKLMGEAESEEAFFYAWMLTGPFRESRNDAFASDEKDFEPLEKAWLEDQADLVEDSLLGRYGLDYLKEEAKEDTWYNHMFLGGNESYSVKKSLITLDDGKLGNLLNKFLVGRVLWRMKGSGLTKTVVSLEILISLQKEVIKDAELLIKHLGIGMTKFGQHQGAYFWLETIHANTLPKVRYRVLSVKARIKTEPTENWNQAVEELDKIGKYLVLGLEIGNLIHCLTEYQNARNSSERVWSGGESLSAASDSIQAVSKLLKETIEEAGAEGIATKLGIIGAIIDVILNTRKAILSIGKNHYGLASGYVLTALSSIALAVGGTLETMGEGVLFLGLSFLPWLVIGGLLLILGTALVYLFTESDLEEWAKNCCWGKRGNRQSGKSELGKQVYRLHEILAKFKVDCYVAPGEILSQSISENGTFTEYQYYLVLCIEAGMFLDGKSRFKVRLDAKDVTVVFEDSIYFSHKEKELLIPESQTIDIKPEHEGEEGGRKFFKRWKLDDPHADFRANNGKYKYDLVAQLDLNGDGKTLLPSEPLVQNGSCGYLPPWRRS